MSVTITIAIATAAAVGGFIFSRVLDTRTINEICNTYEELITSVRKYYTRRERAIIKAYNRSQIEKAARPAERRIKNADVDFFNDLNGWNVPDNDNLFGGF